jgi:hypothetical protein
MKKAAFIPKTNSEEIEPPSALRKKSFMGSGNMRTQQNQNADGIHLANLAFLAVQKTEKVFHSWRSPAHVQQSPHEASSLRFKV